MSVSCESVQIRLEGVRVHNAFVQDKSVTFYAWDDFDTFGDMVPVEVIGLVYINVTLFVERIPDFVKEILFHVPAIQLLRAMYIE